MRHFFLCTSAAALTLLTAISQAEDALLVNELRTEPVTVTAPV